MNILLLSQFLSTTRGGGEYLFSLIAKNLAMKGHKVWVITNKINDEEYKFPENVRVVFVKPTLQYAGGLPTSIFDNIRYSFNTILTGLYIIRKEKINVIHSNNFSPALAGSILSLITSKPHVTSIWDIFSLCGKDYWNRWAQQTGISRIHTFLGPRFEKLILRLPHDAIHTISEASKDDLLEFGAKKPIHVIQPAIEEMVLEPEVLNSFQFVYIGRLVFYKNIEVLIKAIGIAKKTESKIKLVIVGGGPHRKVLEDLTHSLGLESNIEFRGYVTAQEKQKLIGSSIALVFPSLCEGFGLVILEAFQQRKPVLVSNIRPMSEIVLDGKTGFVLDPYQEKVWADRLLGIMRDPKIATKLGNAGYIQLRESHSEDIMTRKILEMYMTLANR